MITISTQVSGSQIGSELANDIEELAYALVAIAEETSSTDMIDVAEYIGDGMAAQEVIAQLEALIAALKGGAA